MLFTKTSTITQANVPHDLKMPFARVRPKTAYKAGVGAIIEAIKVRTCLFCLYDISSPKCCCRNPNEAQLEQIACLTLHAQNDDIEEVSTGRGRREKTDSARQQAYQEYQEGLNVLGDKVGEHETRLGELTATLGTVHQDIKGVVEKMDKSGAQLKDLEARGDATDARLVSFETRLQCLATHNKFLSDSLCNTALSHHKLKWKIDALNVDASGEDEVCASHHE